MKSLKSYEFKAFGAQRSEYDWDKILDGGIYQLTKGEDFESEISSFTTLVRTRAMQRHQKIQISVDDDTRTVVLKATPMTPEETEVNKKRLAALKVKAAEQRKAQKAAKALAKSNGQAPAPTPAVTASDAPTPKPVALPAQPAPKPQPVKAGK